MKSPVPPLPTPGTCRAGVGPVPRATPGLGGGKVGSTHWGPCLPQPTRGCCGGERGTGCKRWRAVGSGAQGGDALGGALLPSPSDLPGGGVTSPQWGERRRRRKPGQHRGRVALRTQFGLRVFSSDAHLVFCSQSFPIALPTSCRDRKLDSRAEEGTGKRLCSQPFVYRISRNRSKCTKPHGDSDVSPCPP